MHASREICKICYHPNPVGYSVPDEIWLAVVPPALREHVVCLSCFTRLADEKLIPWDQSISFFPVSMASHLEFVKNESGDFRSGRSD